MRILIGFLSGVLGLAAGWFGLAFFVISISGHDIDGGVAMGAFFQIGPIGGLVGFIVGVALFLKFGVARREPAAPVPQIVGTAAPLPAAAGSAPPDRVGAKTRVSAPFTIAVLAIVAGLSWWAWYELIRSPYLTHGYMTLDLLFRLPAGSVPPTDPKDIQIEVMEGSRFAQPMLDPEWLRHDGDRLMIFATASLSLKANPRPVRLTLAGLPEQTWWLDLSSDPDPTPEYTRWRASTQGPKAGSR